MVMRPLYEEMCNHWKSGRTVEADLVSDIHDGHIWKEFEDCVFSGSLPRMVWCWMSTGSFHSSIPPIQLGLHIWLTLTYLDLNVSIHPVNLGLEDRKGRDVSKWEGQIHFSVHHVTGIFLHIRVNIFSLKATLSIHNETRYAQKRQPMKAHKDQSSPIIIDHESDNKINKIMKVIES